MTTIYNDGEGGYVALVAHGTGNELTRGVVQVAGLIHYCLSEGRLELFDGATEAFYSIDHNWDGIDWETVDGLYAAHYGDRTARKLDSAYYDAISLYGGVLDNDLVMESLSAFYA